ncbi:MAG: hypothetical protein EB060_03435 [Proteobacteria bacterium]|nr:hypothetical protein [Pseudomonadota bacterium]
MLIACLGFPPEQIGEGFRKDVEVRQVTMGEVRELRNQYPLQLMVLATEDVEITELEKLAYAVSGLIIVQRSAEPAICAVTRAQGTWIEIVAVAIGQYNEAIRTRREMQATGDGRSGLGTEIGFFERQLQLLRSFLA